MYAKLHWAYFLKRFLTGAGTLLFFGGVYYYTRGFIDYGLAFIYLAGSFMVLFFCALIGHLVWWGK